MGHVAFFLLLLVCSCSHALFRGGAPERIGAASCLFAVAATLLVQAELQHRFSNVGLLVFLVDTMFWLSFVVLGAFARRYWPFWVAALLLVPVAAHIVRWIDADMMHFGYAFMLAAPMYGVLPILSLATERHQMRKRRNGGDPPWRRSSATDELPTR